MITKSPITNICCLNVKNLLEIFVLVRCKWFTSCLNVSLTVRCIFYEVCTFNPCSRRRIHKYIYTDTVYSKWCTQINAFKHITYNLLITMKKANEYICKRHDLFTSWDFITSYQDNASRYSSWNDNQMWYSSRWTQLILFTKYLTKQLRFIK